MVLDCLYYAATLLALAIYASTFTSEVSVLTGRATLGEAFSR